MKEKSLKLLKLSLFIVVLFVSTACGAEVVAQVTDTPTPTKLAIITATLPQINTPLPSSTPEPLPTAMPAAPVEGQTTSQVNVRNGPSAASEQIGSIEIFAKVQIVGKDPSSSWWMIAFPEGSEGRGWVTAEFMQVANSANVPVINANLQEVNDAPVAETPLDGMQAAPTSQVGSTAPPTSAFATAPLDGDSVEAPAVNLMLSKVSLAFLDHSSDISSPEGDAEDWVRFFFDGELGQEKIISVVLDCSGSGKLNVELIQNGVTLQSWDDIFCGQRHQLQLYLFVGAPYSLRLSPLQGDLTMSYIAYTLHVDLIK